MAEIKYSGNNTLAALIAAIKALFVKRGEAITSINGVAPDEAGNLEVDLQGQRGSHILKVATSPSSYPSGINGIDTTHRIDIREILSQDDIKNVLVNDYILHSYYLYHVCYVDANYAYINGVTDIHGEDGASVIMIRIIEET